MRTGLTGGILHSLRSLAYLEILQKQGVAQSVIDGLAALPYEKCPENKNQDCANRIAVILRRCEEILDFDTVSKAMLERACCKTGKRLKDVRAIAKAHAVKDLKGRLTLLHGVQAHGASLSRRRHWTISTTVCSALAGA